MSTRPEAPRFPIVAWLERRSRRQRRWGLAVLALAGLWWLARFTAATLLDRWWFESVTSAPVWSTKVLAQVELAVIAAVLTAIVLGFAVRLGLTVGPAPGNGPNRLVVHYRQRMGPAHRWAMIAVVVVLTARVIPAAMGRWQPWVLFLQGPSLGTPAPEIGWDLGYHLFRLPFLTVASTWFRQLLLTAFVLGGLGHVATGALRLPGRGRSSAKAALAHLGGLAGVYAFVQSLHYLFVQRPALATNETGAFDGPGFTELRVVAPALLVLAVVAAVAAAAAGWGVWTGGWRPAWYAFGAWAVTAVVGLGVAPYLVQQFVVRPAEAERQLPFIAHNLDATRQAYRLDAVEQMSVPFADGLTSDPPPDSIDDLARVPLFTETQLVKPLQVLEGTTATRITDVDLDRYVIDGVTRPVLIATRNSDRTGLPEKGWVQTRLVYTHGDGIVAVPADTVAADGRPDVDALAGVLAPARSELYFGEDLAGWYVIVGTKRTEQGGARFDADTGITLTGMWERLVLALAVGEVEPVTSTELTPDSQLLFRREVRERLRMLAPFLAFDGEPYPVVDGDRVVWVVDGYTKASTFPYSQYARNARPAKTSDLAGKSFNYLHAAVKATVDAYDGTVHLYRTEVGGEGDPILEAWSRIFPGLIEPIADMPPGLRSHLLYPPDLLTVQTSLLGRYHVDDPETLFNGSDRWAISAAPGQGVAKESPGASPAVSLFMPSGDLKGHWVAIRPYGPGAANNPTSTRDILSGLAIADHDNPERLRLVRIERRPGRQVSSPLVAQAAIDTDADLAQAFTLLNANGSAVQFGPMTPLPFTDALVWARPIIVTGTAGRTAPRLFGVAAVSNGLVGEAPTAPEAVAAAVRRVRRS